MATVGVLLRARELRRAMRGRSHERLPAYQRAARPWGLRVVFFSPEGVRWHDRTVRGYVYERGRYRRVRVRVPQVIHRRIISSTPGACARSGGWPPSRECACSTPRSAGTS